MEIPLKRFNKKYKTLPVMLCLILATGCFCMGEQQKQESVTIDENSGLADLLMYAALNNPGLKATFDSWHAALERIPQVRALPEPKLNFAYFIREVETRVGPQQGKIGIMQQIPWFGKLKLMGDVARESANAERQAYEKAKLNLFYRVKESYYEYYYINKALSVIEENIQLLEYLEGVIRTRYSTGGTSHANLIKVQLELDKLRDWHESMKDMVIPVAAKLNAALNRSPREPLPVPKKINKVDSPLDYPRMVILLKENNPDLKLLEHLGAKEKISEKLARKNYFPDFSLGLDYIFTGNAIMPEVVDSGKDPMVAMLSINVPIKYKKNRASVREARNRYEMRKHQKKEKMNDLISQLAMIFFRFEDSARKLSLYGDALIPKARQALEVTQSAFTAGSVDFINLIDSQRTLLVFELAYERSLSDLHQRLAELEMLLGKKLSE